MSIPLLGVAAMCVNSVRPQARDSGTAESVFDDLAVLTLAPGLHRLLVPSEPGRLAFAVAATAATAVAFSGVVAADPIDGAMRAVAEAVAVLGCYAVLGRRLGLRA